MTGNAFQGFYPDSSFEPTSSDFQISLVKQVLAAYRLETCVDVRQSTIVLEPVRELTDNEQPLFPGLSGVFVLMPCSDACPERTHG